ncbi:MAG TPA: anti-sigma factor [Solirubrobacteraceae bacterium]|nr:anti-sigma factor [Solirubrobacteraceae bacterium]
MADRDCGNEAAAYALGALEPAEAEAFKRHMETCAVCRDEVAAFALVVDALPLAAPQHQAPRALRRRVLAAARAQPPPHAASTRPRRAWPLLAGAPRPALAALVVALAALALVGGIELGAGGTHRQVIRASVGDAELTVDGSHGQLIVEKLPAPAPGRIYELWLQHGSSAPAPSTLFSVSSHGTADVGVPGDLHGVSHILVTDEPAGGSATPTGKPLIVAALG